MIPALHLIWIIPLLAAAGLVFIVLKAANHHTSHLIYPILNEQLNT